MKNVSTVVLAAALAACASKPDPETVRSITRELIEGCPMTAPNDESARDRCSDRLARSTALAGTMSDSILWGGYNPDNGDSFVPEERSLTDFDSLVFRRLYLSMYMFGGGSTLEERDGLWLLRVPAQFRNGMSEGSYPYPFWHSQNKWNAYQASTEVIFVFREGRIVAGYRAGNDESRKTQERGPFDGTWIWVDQTGEEQPHVALFSYLLSPENPHLFDLDTAYRAFESEARMNMCEVCHAPDNIAKMNPLVILNLPNQALVARHELKEVFRTNSMPPQVGLDEETRAALTSLAEEFARIGDLALEFEEGYYIQ